ncbi:MAG TPA: nucleoside-diphosphate kinase [Gemmatales bacterium]|nr:nucleoside-diphosphate kinase [Gemmatales bacterium]HMP58715.1 nucleoside-diphosphate kinase [Gemmatales bacterium]
MQQRTLVLFKPDCVQRRLIGTLFARFEQKGLRLVGLKFLRASESLAQQHYAVHKEKKFFPGLVQFLTSGPTVAMVWEGPSVIEYVRNLIGSTDGMKAAIGTIRGDLAVSIQNNLVHASDSPDSAATEIALWFKPEELVDWQPVDRDWLTGA